MTPDAGERRSAALPPGQRARGDLPRFGLPAFARRWPRVPPSPALRVDGDVEQPLQLDAGELAQLSRRTQTSDLHCVTTWSALGLVWSGVRFRDVYDELVVPRARPRGGCAHVVLAGRDGYRTSLPLEDALAPDVLLADRLTGEPLALEHGAPLRLVAPAHYGYKSVKHLVSIELRAAPARGTAGALEHPRGRVDVEERGRALPGWAYRRLWRALLPAYGRWFERRSRRSRPR